MLVVLPPSETKTQGGITGTRLDLAALAYAATLSAVREHTIAQLAQLCVSEQAAAKALALGPRQYGEIAANRLLRDAATQPAIERYTGVLYDGIGVDSLDAGAREWLGRHALVQSALFGLIGAADPIPHYRLSATTRLGGESLSARWAGPTSEILAAAPGPVLDLRSQAYVGLGPISARPDAVHVDVRTRSAQGVTRALNHFNKKAKGQLVRALALSDASTLEDVVAAAEQFGAEFRYNIPGQAALTLVEAA